MKIPQTCASMMIVGGMLLFSGGAVQAEQPSTGTPPGGAMGSGSGTGSGGTGGSTGSMKQDQRHGFDGRTDVPKTKGDPTLGGSGRTPDSSSGNPGSKGTPGQGSSGGSGSGMGSGSGSMGGSSGGTGSSGGGY